MEAVKGLRAVKANIIGTVFNGEESQRENTIIIIRKINTK